MKWNEEYGKGPKEHMVDHEMIIKDGTDLTSNKVSHAVAMVAWSLFYIGEKVGAGLMRIGNRV